MHASRGDDDIDLEIKLQFATRRLEEKENLVSHLRSLVDSVVVERDTLSQRCDTLKRVQSHIEADKKNLSDRVDALISEKAELAAENASLRVAAKDLQRSNALFSAADQLSTVASSRLSNPPDSARENHGATNSAAEDQEALRSKLKANRAVIVSLLELLRRHGIVVSQSEIAAGIGSACSAAASSSTAGLARAELIASLADALSISSEVRQAAGQSGAGSRPSGAASVIDASTAGAGAEQIGLASEASKGSLAVSASTSSSSSSNPSALPSAVAAADNALKPAPAAPAQPGFFGRLWSVLIGDVPPPTPDAAVAAAASSAPAPPQPATSQVQATAPPSEPRETPAFHNTGNAVQLSAPSGTDASATQSTTEAAAPTGRLQQQQVSQHPHQQPSMLDRIVAMEAETMDGAANGLHRNGGQHSHHHGHSHGDGDHGHSHG